MEWILYTELEINDDGKLISIQCELIDADDYEIKQEFEKKYTKYESLTDIQNYILGLLYYHVAKSDVIYLAKKNRIHYSHVLYNLHKYFPKLACVLH